jgi:hypothetical protein
VASVPSPTNATLLRMTVSYRRNGRVSYRRNGRLCCREAGAVALRNRTETGRCLQSAYVGAPNMIHGTRTVVKVRCLVSCRPGAWTVCQWTPSTCGSTGATGISWVLSYCCSDVPCRLSGFILACLISNTTRNYAAAATAKSAAGLVCARLLTSKQDRLVDSLTVAPHTMLREKK